jgi:hypothetical protein
MSETTWHRIVDWNRSIHGLEKQTSFEAGFYLSEEKALFLYGRIVDSNGLEIFRSGDVRDLLLECYQTWNPTEELKSFIDAIDLQTVEIEPAYFQTPSCEMTFEVKGPIANPKVFGTTIHMGTRFMILGNYEWRDSGHISISMLCEKESLLRFLRSLQDDLSRLLSIRAK